MILSCELFLPYAVLLLNPFLCNSHLTQAYIKGTLSSPWTLNFTVFLEEIKGSLLYCIDYEWNNLMISFGTVQKSGMTLVFKYNTEVKSITLISLCGCDPCNEELVNFYLYSSNEVINLNCNNHGQFNLRKVNIIGRVNNDIPEPIKVITGTRHQIYVSIALDNVGCLESFLYQDRTISFTAFGSDFKLKCARRCSRGVCNGGKCRAFDASGSKCNCSSTTRNGPTCNDRLKNYGDALVNSYLINGTSDAVSIKLSWKQVLYKRYCLLEFVHRHGRIVMSINDKYLLRDSELLSNINPDVINFVSITIVNNRMAIKVNNILVNLELVLFGNISVNVGFTENRGECDTFEGVYDFVYEKSQLHEVQKVSSYTTITSQSSQLGAVSILIGFVSAVTAMLIIGGVVAVVIFIKKCKSKEQKTENVYYSESHNAVAKEQTPYESLNSDDIFLEKYNANARSNRSDSRSTLRTPNVLPPLPNTDSV